MKTIIIFFVGSYLNVVSYISKSYAGKVAITLFSKPRKGKITEIQGNFLDTAFKEKLKFKGNIIMTYRWLGTKQTILLAHGWESNSARWKPLIDSLKKRGFNIVALDAPAHGNSGGKHFNAILYSEFIHVAAKRFKANIITGHSMAGMAAVFCQNKYHMEHVHKLVLLGVPSEYTEILNRYANMLRYNRRIRAQLDTIIVERYGEHPESFSTAKRLKNIDIEGLIIHDEDDPIIPYGDALLIKNSYRNSTLITTKGLDHSLNSNNVITHITEFVDA